MQIENDEHLISFDIESYFPSVTLDKALNVFKDWLNKQKNLDSATKDALFELTKICMNQTYFEF